MTDYFPKMYGRRNPYFEALLKEGTNTSPIGAHSQGMSRLAFSLLAGLERGQMDREERERAEQSQGKRELLGQQADSPMLSSSPDGVTDSAAAGAGVSPSPTSPMSYPAVGGVAPRGWVRAGIPFSPFIGRRE